jgi:uncharacterized membrane protein (UPF0127 family)
MTRLISLALLAACGATRRPAVESPVVVVCRGHALRVELALDEETQARGLMFRRALEPDAGMLFVNARDELMSLWMKDTYVPLSAAFLDAEGRVVNIVDMDPFDETHHRSAGPVRFALEANRGWFAERGVGPGDRCEIALPR